MDEVFMDSVTRRYRVGDQVQGTVCGIQSDAILIDINAKSEATLPVEDPNSFYHWRSTRSQDCSHG